ATVAANATSYDDTAVNTQGTRYLYRVVPRCVVGSTLGTPSQLAMVALQDFEGIAAGTDLLTGTPLTNGWTVNYNNSAGANQVAAITATALGGARSAEFTEVSQNAPSSALTLSPPHINDRAGLGTIGVSRFEMMHSLAGSAQQNVGYTILTNTGRFANNTSTTGPQLPNNWRWMNPALLTSFGYNDATNSGLTNQFSNIAPAGNFNFGVGAAVEAFTAMDCTAGTITNAQDYVFIAAAATTTNPDEQMRFDDLAWIVY
ncbi:MAG TPA: hypothetical protein VEI97_19810, partial [bacterium]|nr:hypothetical protein [bacterium]